MQKIAVGIDQNNREIYHDTIVTFPIGYGDEHRIGKKYQVKVINGSIELNEMGTNNYEVLGTLTGLKVETNALLYHSIVVKS